MAKETKLQENADIYKRRHPQSDKQKLRDMEWKERIQYFKDYYLKTVLISIVAVALIGYLFYTIFSPKQEIVFTAAIINDAISSEKNEELTTEFSDYLNINSEKQGVQFDSSYFLSDDQGELEIATRQKITTRIFASELDVMIADRSTIEGYATSSSFIELSELLPTNIYSGLSDELCFFTPAEGTEEVAYGISLKNCDWYEKSGSVLEDPVMAVLASSKYKENSIDFVRYLFNIK